MRIFFFASNILLISYYFVHFIILHSISFYSVSFHSVLFCFVAFPFGSVSYFIGTPLVCTCLQYKSFENAKMEKLLVMSNFFFSDCFLPFWRTFCYFHQIQNSRLHTLSVWKSLKFVIWEIAKPHSVFYILLIGINLKSVLKQCHIWLPSSPYQKK